MLQPVEDGPTPALIGVRSIGRTLGFEPGYEGPSPSPRTMHVTRRSWRKIATLAGGGSIPSTCSVKYRDLDKDIGISIRPAWRIRPRTSNPGARGSTPRRATDVSAHGRDPEFLIPDAQVRILPETPRFRAQGCDAALRRLTIGFDSRRNHQLQLLDVLGVRHGGRRFASAVTCLCIPMAEEAV